VGAIAEHAGPRWSLGLGAAACAAAALVGVALLHRRKSIAMA
jgi:hypothetical protein